MIPGAVHRSPGIYLTAEENRGKSLLRDRLVKGLCDQSMPQMRVPFLQMREKEGKKERTG